MDDDTSEVRLLSKTNPDATRRSLAVAALLGVLGGGLLWHFHFPAHTVASLLACTIGGAFVGALVEWQVYD